MPPNTAVRGGTLPLESLFTFKPKQRPPTLPPPDFTRTLILDSTKLLSGLFCAHGEVEYAIATSGSETVISRPVQSINVAVIEWKQGWVETEGLRISLNEWVDESKWGSSRAHVFTKWGKNPELRWEVKNAEWKATSARRQVLAAFTVRPGALGTHIKFTHIGRPHADALVLTGVLSVIEDAEWQQHLFFQARRNAVGARLRSTGAGPMSAGETADGTASQLPAENLPNYREVSFTRPVGPLFSTRSDPSHPMDEPGPPADRPINLVLSSRHLLNGTWYEGDHPVVRVQTLGPRTTISRFGYTEQGAEPSMKVVGVIDWTEGKATVLGVDIQLGQILRRTSKSSMFSKTNRKSVICTLPTLTSYWTTTPHTSSASLYPDPNPLDRYECRSGPPENNPLALITHCLKRRGAVMELTPQGHGALVEVLVGVLVLVYGPTGEWKKVAGVGANLGGEESELALGEEMVSDLDGWAGPVELMRLRRQEGSGDSL